MFFLVLLFLVICLVLLCDFLQKRSYRWKKLYEFPGDTPLPLVGNSLQLGFDADESSHKLLAMWERHGMQNFRVSVGSENWIMLTNPGDIGTILSHKTELYKPLERNVAMKPYFGDSLSSSEDEKWRSTRKLMMPSFHFRTLEGNLMHVNEHCDQLLDIFDTYEDKGPVEVYRYLRPYMYDILCTTLMGVESNLLSKTDHEYLKATGKYVNVVIEERKKKLNGIIEETLKNYKNVEIDTEKLIESKVNGGGSLLDRLLTSKLTDGEIMKDKDINDEVTLLNFTGHYTTTMTISHTLYFLSKYTEVQNRVFEEQRSVFNNDLNKNPTIHDLNQMKYLEAVIKESLRIIPTITKIGRQLKNDLTFKDGRVAPAGTSIMIFFEAMFRDPKLFPEPEKYKPERFLEPMHTFAFVPFSAGTRSCIGFRYAWVAMKATLSNILRRYEVTPGGPGTEPQFVNRIVMESKNGVQIRLKKRDLKGINKETL